MDADECASILEWYPEMILISKTPVTWQGFLKIQGRREIGHIMRLKLKLFVPNYPSLYGAKLYFGKTLCVLHSEVFISKVTHLLQNTSTIFSFLKQLHTIVSDTIDKMHCTVFDVMETVVADQIKQLKDALEISSVVSLSSTSDFSIVKLSIQNVSVKLQRTNSRTNFWQLISSDVPNVAGVDPFEETLSNLKLAKQKFESQVEMFQNCWEQLHEIDQNCWVIDPLVPKPYHLYRRIYLTPVLSLLLTIDPLNPTDLPNIKFLGSHIEVNQQRDVVSRNIHSWNPMTNILENLRMLLSVTQFPPKIDFSDNIKEKDVVVSDEECCICFSLELGTEHIPNRICGNIKCRRRFHTVCLLQWLQAVAGNQIAFDHIHGVCPHCEHNISCPIK